ncbi:MAG: hypothetical protein N2258_00685, partial [Brevinematales bacterium]|nr:hypothetical protein [Brevinematales bacterium]
MNTSVDNMDVFSQIKATRYEKAISQKIGNLYQMKLQQGLPIYANDLFGATKSLLTPGENLLIANSDNMTKEEYENLKSATSIVKSSYENLLNYGIIPTQS